jgi:hypothetical protein
VQGRLHVAFAVEDRETVDAFHAAALEAGATDNGAPGVRETYHPDYYGAYVLDPDGHKHRGRLSQADLGTSAEVAALSAGRRTPPVAPRAGLT